MRQAEFVRITKVGPAAILVVAMHGLATPPTLPAPPALHQVPIEPERPTHKSIVYAFDASRGDPRLAALGAAGLGQRQPNPLALHRAAMCIEIAKTMHIGIEQVTTSAIGGVALAFAGGSKIALLECDNEGDIVAMISDRSVDQDADTWVLLHNFDTSVPNALHKISAFMGGTGATAS